MQAKKFLKEANDKAKKDLAKGDAATCATAAGSITGDALKTSMQECLKAKRDVITDKSEKAKYIKGQKDTAKDEAASALKACIGKSRAKEVAFKFFTLKVFAVPYCTCAVVLFFSPGRLCLFSLFLQLSCP